jgi:hypothetical protein
MMPPRRATDLEHVLEVVVTLSDLLAGNGTGRSVAYWEHADPFSTALDEGPGETLPL